MKKRLHADKMARISSAFLTDTSTKTEADLSPSPYQNRELNSYWCCGLDPNTGSLVPPHTSSSLCCPTSSHATSLWDPLTCLPCNRSKQPVGDPGWDLQSSSYLVIPEEKKIKNHMALDGTWSNLKFCENTSWVSALTQHRSREQACSETLSLVFGFSVLTEGCLDWF